MKPLSPDWHMCSVSVVMVRSTLPKLKVGEYYFATPAICTLRHRSPPPHWSAVKRATRYYWPSNNLFFAYQLRWPTTKYAYGYPIWYTSGMTDPAYFSEWHHICILLAGGLHRGGPPPALASRMPVGAEDVVWANRGGKSDSFAKVHSH